MSDVCHLFRGVRVRVGPGPDDWVIHRSAPCGADVDRGWSTIRLDLVTCPDCRKRAG